jgi:conjugative relaxase-like TrwC/TraI family protein
MLSLMPIKSVGAACTYFEMEKYYIQDICAPNSQWFGHLSKEIGIAGKGVYAAEFQKYLQGITPDGQKLSSGRKEGGTHRPGYDLTFSAPKSVSIMAEVFENAITIKAHQSAVEQTLNYIEETGIIYRQRVGKNVKNIKSTKMLVATFKHGTSRENEPATHTHCILMNMTKDKDGNYKAITSETLYANKMLYGMVYRSFLANELVKSGVEIERTHDDGRFEIKGFTQEQLDAFSTRRKQIVQYLFENKLTGAIASSIAAQVTRKKKVWNLARKISGQNGKRNANPST